MTNSDLVTKQSDLETHCRIWRSAGSLAFDTEFIRDDTYESALCLVQVADGSKVTLIDPTCGLDMDVFWDLVTDERVTAVLHAGKEDFEVCLRATGQPPRNVFDVQIAAGFLGHGYPLSLSRLVGEVIGRQISKGQTLTDWLRRPLTDAQIRYAIEDVVHLPAIYQQLSAGLVRSGRVEWAAEEFRRFEEPDYYQPPVRDRLFRVKGTKRLDGLGLAVLERLLDWRDEWAQARNRPIRALMRDDVMVEIARRRPKRESDLQVLRGFPQAHNPKIIGEILRIIKDVRETPESGWPKPFRPPEELPMSKVMVDILSAVCRAVCYEQGVSHELLGSAQRLRELLEYYSGRTAERPALLCGWREEFIGQRLLDLLEGHSELHITGWPDNPHLEVVTHSTEPSS
ncbi:MAG: ribonuclease D [Planctomycetota bacterium]